MKKAHHFYLVFNPMINKAEHYESQAHEFYFHLKNKVQNQESNPFLYWGKISVNSQGSRARELQAIVLENTQNGFDTHLYITDYHQFWVAKVNSVHSEISNYSNTLSFYEGKNVDIWFKLTDMDMISGEFEETAYYLENLYIDNQYHSEKISAVNPYLGGLEFPMVVQDKLNDTYFKRMHFEDSLKILRNNPLIENLHGAKNLKHQFKSFVLPPQVFWKLSGSVKNELFQAELALTQNQATPESLQSILNSYLRILEGVVNDTLGKIIKDQFGDCVFTNSDGTKLSDQMSEGYVSLDNFHGNISLQAFQDLVTDVQGFGNLSLDNMNQKYAKMTKYYVNTLVPFMQENELAALRNQMAENKEFTLSKSFVFSIRNQILGVGTKGVINNLVLTYLEAMDQNNHGLAA